MVVAIVLVPVIVIVIISKLIVIKVVVIMIVKPKVIVIRRASNFRQYGQLQSRPEKSSQKKEDQHASRVTRKKTHAREMLGLSRIAMFFQ